MCCMGCSSLRVCRFSLSLLYRLQPVSRLIAPRARYHKRVLLASSAGYPPPQDLNRLRQHLQQAVLVLDLRTPLGCTTAEPPSKWVPARRSCGELTSAPQKHVLHASTL